MHVKSRIWLLAVLLTGLAACGGGDGVIRDQGPEALYENGTDMLNGQNYQGAIQNFQILQARYPFANETRQAQLDLIYAYYMAGQPQLAIEAAEAFERENPTHPRVDYTLYMRGLALFDPSANFLERLFRVDLTARPPKDSLRAFQLFQELLRRYPDSEYAADARQRMVWLRNRLAAYENHVARYYIRRGAYVAAVDRAKYAIEAFPGAPELEESLMIMAEAYDRLDLPELAQDARRVLERTYGDPRARLEVD